MAIGDRIKKRREELGLTLEAIGNQLNVHRSTIKRYESGDTQRIPLKTIEKLAAILKTTPEYLMGWEAEEPSPQDELDPEIVIMARAVQKLPKDKKDILLKIVKTMSDIADEELTK